MTVNYSPTSVQDAIDGGRRAVRTVRSIADGFAAQDALLNDLLEVLDIDGAAPRRTPRLRSWCRAVQKAIEGSR